MTIFPDIVTRAEWQKARAELLIQEKDLTRARDRVNEARRRLPMVRVSDDYRFFGPHGAVTLGDLFDGRDQLIVHHFMFAPDWETPCPSCSSAADGIAGLRLLHARNTTLVAVSRAAYPRIAAIQQRMGWTFPWYSSDGESFNRDHLATRDDGEWPGISVFLRAGDEVFHTYSTYLRGIEEFHNQYPYLDLTALGRQEHWEKPHGRATPLGRQVGGPGMRLPDEY
ncbi:DUF899 domain-containing protein [Actinoplanes rectilineatus]|uniref:DUF899 domain-containing protein n=1 Tax=Actinoplanes rectilineatus TaxID=113571 RepID=UPI0005F2C835|nr:DUF899 domain-containing protein [Actinoplanes rectilineatus]